MLFIDRLLVLGPSILLSALNLLSCHADASSINPINPLHPAPQLPFQLPQKASQSTNKRSWYLDIRDCLIKSIWQIDTDNSLSGATDKENVKTSGPPPKLLARYGGDLVLRFNFKSIQEAEALNEAVNVLFLDVWEFTAEWVDIRLSEDIVSLRPLLPTL